MGYLEKMLGCGVLAVGAIAAAPFTGGGSVVGGVTLAASLSGTGLVTSGVAVGGAALGAVGQYAEDKREEERILNAKSSSFENGVFAGKGDTVKELKKFYDFILANTAISYYVARCDDYNLSEAEMAEISYDLNAFMKIHEIPIEIKNEINGLQNMNLTFDNVVHYLDKLSFVDINTLYIDAKEIAEADDVINNLELNALKTIRRYIDDRGANI